MFKSPGAPDLKLMYDSRASQVKKPGQSGLLDTNMLIDLKLEEKPENAVIPQPKKKEKKVSISAETAKPMSSLVKIEPESEPVVVPEKKPRKPRVAKVADAPAAVPAPIAAALKVATDSGLAPPRKRLVKGSQEAKDHMAAMRAKRTVAKETASGAPTLSVTEEKPVKVKKSKVAPVPQTVA